MTAGAVLGLLLMNLPLLAQNPLIEGNADSAVRVVIYEDLQCSDCAVFRKMLDERLLPKYRATVAFEHRDFPLAKHSWARKAAIASRFFQQQSAEVCAKYRRTVMAEQPRITAANFEEHLAAFARGNGIDPAKTLAALHDPVFADWVEKDFQDGVARGIARTPTALVNGEPFIEVFTVEEISKAIDENLKQAAVK
jgi:protein-disulfide isomerase